MARLINLEKKSDEEFISIIQEPPMKDNLKKERKMAMGRKLFQMDLPI